jgi:hypothetical protein
MPLGDKENTQDGHRMIDKEAIQNKPAELEIRVMTSSPCTHGPEIDSYYFQLFGFTI